MFRFVAHIPQNESDRIYNASLRGEMTVPARDKFEILAQPSCRTACTPHPLRSVIACTFAPTKN